MRQMRTRNSLFGLVLGWAALSFGLTANGQAVSTPAEPETESSTQSSEPLPSAQEILDAHIEATGGRERLEKRKSIVTKGAMSIPAAGIKAEMTVTVVAPMRMAVDAEIEGIGSIARCSDKGVAWEIDPMMGARLLEGEELQMAFREADTTADLHPEKYFKKMECTGLVDVDGKPAYRLEMTTHEDSLETYYYDKESRLLVKVKRDLQTALGKIRTEMLISDYRDVNGAVMPHKTILNMMGHEQIITTESIVFDTEVDEAAFDIPEEIQELIAARKKKEAAKENEETENEETADIAADDDAADGSEEESTP